MGLLLFNGNPMEWGTPENDAAIPHVLIGGVRQFLNVYNRCKGMKGYPFRWGEELEHLLVEEQTDPVSGKTTILLALDAADAIDTLNAEKTERSAGDWHPEHGSFMVESIPSIVYRDTIDSFCSVEGVMRERVRLLDEVVSRGGKRRYSVMMVTFPLLGVGAFTNRPNSTESTVTGSLFIPDICVNQSHPRYSAVTRNTRLRRDRKFSIQIPLFIDDETIPSTVDKALNLDYTDRNGEINCEVLRPWKCFSCCCENIDGLLADCDLVHYFTPTTDRFYSGYAKSAVAAGTQVVCKHRNVFCPYVFPTAFHPCIYMDAMAFGAGCCCLQVTMQLSSLEEARHVYDQHVVLAPLFLALTSATPVMKGLLCDSDVRWMTISGASDDRKRSELCKIMKSRYDSVSLYVAESNHVNTFNDLRVEYNQEAFDMCITGDVDEMLAMHIASLFARDPLVIYDQAVVVDDSQTTEHFESIQSTNWQSVRLKLPSPDADIGWRVEFRCMEIMPTPFENAAFATFITLLTKAIVQRHLSFYTLISLVDENMGTAHRREPCNQTYHVRKDPFDAVENMSPSSDEMAELTINEIFNGCEEFPGLIPIVREYIRSVQRVEGSSAENIITIEKYLAFIAMRARGDIPTTATYIRQFVAAHPAYTHNSRVGGEVALDLVRRVQGLGSGAIQDNAYLPMAVFEAMARSEGERGDETECSWSRGEDAHHSLLTLQRDRTEMAVRERERDGTRAVCTLAA